VNMLSKWVASIGFFNKKSLSLAKIGWSMWSFVNL
jgi:hypothetical protein